MIDRIEKKGKAMEIKSPEAAEWYARCRDGIGEIVYSVVPWSAVEAGYDDAAGVAIVKRAVPGIDDDAALEIAEMARAVRLDAIQVCELLDRATRTEDEDDRAALIEEARQIEEERGVTATESDRIERELGGEG